LGQRARYTPSTRCAASQKNRRKRSLSVGARRRQSCIEHLPDAGALLGVGIRAVHVVTHWGSSYQRTTPLAACASRSAAEAASNAAAARCSSAAVVTVPVAPSPRPSSPL